MTILFNKIIIKTKTYSIKIISKMKMKWNKNMMNFNNRYKLNLQNAFQKMIYIIILTTSNHFIKQDYILKMRLNSSKKVLTTSHNHSYNKINQLVINYLIS